MRTIKIGTRKSRLACIQAELVAEYIRQSCEGIQAELVKLVTTGDRILTKGLDEIGGKGVFVKELDNALLSGETDLSVHSLKDMPMEIAPEIPLIGFSRREDARDVLVLPEDAKEYDYRGPIGCSSNRRSLQLKEIFPKAEIKTVRGNVLTRLEKLDHGEYGALVLAAAGLKRLGLTGRISRYFSMEEMIPAAGQGILGIQGRLDEDYNFLDGFFDQEAKECALGERAFMAYLNGGCSLPIGVYAEILDEKQMRIRGLYYHEENHVYKKMCMTGDRCRPEELGIMLARQLQDQCRQPASRSRNLSEQAGQLEYTGQAEQVKEMERIKRTGKVWLVGAGPGAGDLLTIKAKRLLQAGDCIVYDRLVGDEVLSMVPTDKELIDVGKSVGKHTMSQEEINRILVREAKSGKKVVRLKGGDPFLFGRGGEEAEALCREDIRFEVIPGISSSLAVPAYHGIPVTHRDYVSSVHIITGHYKDGKTREIPYEALVKAQGTLVFLMGVAALEDIMNGLLLAGMDRNMPAAILQQGTTAAQRRVLATIETLAWKAKEHQFKAPSIIVVGKVCQLSDRFGWYEGLPLFGEKIVVTRPEERGFELQDQLKALGAEVLSVPVIRTVPVQDESRLQAIQAELERLDQYQVLAFTSPYGVELFFGLLLEQNKDIRAVSHMRFAAIGQGTADALQKKGIRADYLPKQYDGVSLGRLLAGELEDGTRILLARSSIGAVEILQEIEKNPSLAYTDLAIYDTKYAEGNGERLRSFMETGTVTKVVFTSSSTVEGFCRLLGSYPYEKIRAICIGKRTEQAAKNQGMQTVSARNATMEDVVKCIERLPVE